MSKSATSALINPERMGITFAGAKGTCRVYSANATSLQLVIL
ncbi:MAG: hypothetical protein RIR34_833, partial [Actinomycetota bacterium]